MEQGTPLLPPPAPLMPMFTARLARPYNARVHIISNSKETQTTRWAFLPCVFASWAKQSIAEKRPVSFRQSRVYHSAFTAVVTAPQTHDTTVRHQIYRVVLLAHRSARVVRVVRRRLGVRHVAAVVSSVPPRPLRLWRVRVVFGSVRLRIASTRPHVRRRVPGLTTNATRNNPPKKINK